MMKFSAPRSLEDLWQLFEMMISMISSVPDHCQKDSDQSTFRVSYPSSEFVTALPQWSEVFPAISDYLNFEDQGSTKTIVIKPLLCSKALYDAFIHKEFEKNVYEYALKCYPGGSYALVEYWDSSSWITYEAVSSWIGARAAFLEPKILFFKASVDYILGHKLQSFSWYWFSRFRVISDVHKNQVRGFISLDQWGEDLMRAYLGTSYKEWSQSLTAIPQSLAEGVTLFECNPAVYEPSWVLREGIMCGEAFQLLPRDQWPFVDKVIIDEIRQDLGLTYVS